MITLGMLERTAHLRSSQVRQNFGLSAHAPIDIVKVLKENADVSFVFKRFTSSLSGMFLRMPNAKVIVVNTAKSVGHQRFTVAHEYYHLLYDTGMVSRVCSTGKFSNQSQSEVEADYFAAALLMPADAVANRLAIRLGTRQEIYIEDIIDLEQHFGVSHRAMMVRLKHIGYLTEDQYKRFELVPVTHFARSVGYDVSLYMPTNEEKVVSSYAERAKQALDRGLITFGKYEQLLLAACLSNSIYGRTLPCSRVREQHEQTISSLSTKPVLPNAAIA